MVDAQFKNKKLSHIDKETEFWLYSPEWRLNILTGKFERTGRMLKNPVLEKLGWFKKRKKKV